MDQNTEKDGKKSNIEKVYKEARQEIRKKARESRKKVHEIADRESFEELLKRQQSERAKELP